MWFFLLYKYADGPVISWNAVNEFRGVHAPTCCVIAAGHFLLTSLLTDVLVASQPSRVVTVSSAALELGTMQWDDLMFDASFS